MTPEQINELREQAQYMLNTPVRKLGLLDALKYAKVANAKDILALLDELERLQAERDELAERRVHVESETRRICEDRDDLAAKLAKVTAPVADEREAFEAELNPHARRINEHGDYVLPSIQDRWAGWQARAALQPAQSAQPDDQEPAAYLHRMEKTTELSFWGEDAECTGRKDWIGFAPLFLHRDKGYLASFAKQYSVPDGWESELLDWVSACQSAYHIDSTPGHRFGGLGSNLEENRQAVVDYVRDLLAAAPQPAAETVSIELKPWRKIEAAPQPKENGNAE